MNQYLKKMVLHDITDNTILIKVTSTTVYTSFLFENDLVE